MSGFGIAAEFLPDVLGLASDDGVGQIDIILRTQRGVAAARDGRVALIPVVGQQIGLTTELHPHAADADEIGVRCQGNAFDVFVDDFNLPIARTQRRQGRQAERRVHRPRLRQDLVDRPPEAPETFGELRVDQQ